MQKNEEAFREEMISDMTVDCMTAQKTMKEKLALVKKVLRGGLQI